MSEKPYRVEFYDVGSRLLWSGYAYWLKVLGTYDTSSDGREVWFAPVDTPENDVFFERKETFDGGVNFTTVTAISDEDFASMKIDVDYTTHQYP